jgi:membrane associated rhomboid family serine protease
MQGKKVTWISFSIAFLLVLAMWLVFSLDYVLELDLYKFGLYPKKASGLIGVITSPFIHSTQDFSHILNNSAPAFVLTWLLFYHYRTLAMRSFIFIYLFTGLGMWFFARENYHIGMSGIIYGLTAFLVISGFVRKNMRVAAISLMVVFLYGSMVWGIFPTKVGVSWEAHFLGLLSGIMIAIYFRKSGPQPGKMIYEVQEELGIEPTEEYWKVGYKPQPKEEAGRIIINYTVVPTKPKVVHEQNKKPKTEE